jgi:hypothetical protein
MTKRHQDLCKVKLFKKQQVTVYCLYSNPGVKGQNYNSRFANIQ